MGLFNKSDKPLYQYKMMERINCDLDSAVNNHNPGFADHSKIIAESPNYRFYSYKTFEDNSGGYVIRRSKSNPNERVFFGKNYQMACVFDSYLIQCGHSGERGRFYIHAKHIETGKAIECDWLGQGDVYVVINGYGRFYVQDTIKDIGVEGNKLILHIKRKKSTRNDSVDKNDIDTEYTLIVTIENGQFKPNAVFNTIPLSHTDGHGSDQPPRKLATIDDPKMKGLGRTESRHISCKYAGRENECPKECNTCEISIKTEADIALARGSIDEAIGLYERALAIEPKFAEAWVNMANAYGMKKNYEKSVEAFDKAIAIDPKYGKALLGKAISLKNLGRLSEALELAQLVNVLYPGNDNVLNIIKELNETKPVAKPATTETPQVNREASKVEQVIPAPTGWHLMCSYSASLWQMVSEKRTNECGSRGDSSILQSGDYFTPVLKMENYSGYSLPAFTVEYVIDGIERGNWTIDSMDDGIIQSLWLTNKIPQIAANYGHHSIVYSILGHEVCSFSWFIENHKYDWLASLSCSAALQQYKENTYIKRVGLLGRKSLLEKEQYYSPVLTLKNNCMSDTPTFVVKCSIDGHSDISWANSTIKPGEIRNFKFSFDTAQQYMGIGKHTITYSVFDQVIGKLDWEIKL